MVTGNMSSSMDMMSSYTTISATQQSITGGSMTGGSMTGGSMTGGSMTGGYWDQLSTYTGASAMSSTNWPLTTTGGMYAGV
jgi:hypothetical protein